ncbi:MAG TPA: MFS transporter [Thermoanaerobaculia bacterium]|jgi:hypothetical protein
MLTFLVVWGGQLVSLFGSSLTSFALGVWVYQRTGMATKFALMGFFSTLPAILFSPVAGALVDRWDRKWALILSEAGPAMMTLALVALLVLNHLALGYIYAAMVVSSLFTAFQWPAYSATTPLLIPKEQLGRANGLEQSGQAASQLLAPAAAGFLLAAIHIQGVMLLDVATYLVALLTLIYVRLPRPNEPAGGEIRLSGQVRAGWRFVADRPGLMALLLYLAMINMLAGFNLALATPLVLSIGSPAALGIVLSVSSAGLLAGGFVMSVQGGPRRRMAGVLGFGLLYGLSFVLVGLGASLPAIAAASFLLMFSVPLINGCSQAVWQSKVPPALQGRVFAVRRMIAQATLPLAFLIAGPLADWVFRPLLTESGALAGTLGRLLGTGDGRGIGLLYILLGILALGGGAVAWRSGRFRRLEEELPDWDA